MNELPVDAQRQILLGMSYDDVINICHTNQHFNDVICNDMFWGQMINRDYGIAIANLPVLPAGVNRRNLYHIIGRLQGLPLGRNDINAVLIAMGVPA